MWAALVVFLVAGSKGPALQPLEIVAAIQIHGNTATSDDEVKRLAGIAIGAPYEAKTTDEVVARLKATKRFDRVEALKRFASIADASQILLVIVVDEGPVKIERTGDTAQPVRIVRSHPLNLMVMPVLGREDGYGMTYGVKLARPGIAGKDSRLAFPLTWGGDKRAGVEFEKAIARGPIDRLSAGIAIARRTNPFFGEDDDRWSVWLRGEREIVRGLRAGATAGWQRVEFMDARDRFTHAGADVVVDTRVDPTLPRNAIYARAAWEHLRFGSSDAGPAEAGRHVPGLKRIDLDARGYLGLFGQNILAVRALRRDADQPLPAYLKPLLGGMTNLRGFRAGSAAGDTLVATSAELIVPLSSPVSVGKIGVSAFIDAGTAYAKGQRFADQTLKQGYGGSLWFSAAFLHLNIAVAHGRGSSTRMHVGGTVTF